MYSYKKIIASLACLVLLAGCRQSTETIKREDIESSNSILLENLIQTKDFKGGWTWVYDSTFQKDIVPSSENNFLTETATKGLEGHYNNDIYNIVEVWHTLYCYADEAPEIKSLTFSGLEKNNIPAFFTAKRGETVSSCRVIEDKTNCDAVTKYKNIISEVSVEMTSKFSDQKEAFIDSILLTLVDRFPDITKCHQ